MVVLGLDAAWTPHHATGCAVISGTPGNWTCQAAWSTAPIQAAEILASSQPDVVSVDMPLARSPITKRRACDNALSRAFGACGCSVHSPSPERPGRVSTELMRTLSESGYELAVCGTALRGRQVIEVYPHIAVMRLVNESYRVKYKVGRIRQYWPDDPPSVRIRKLRAELRRILTALKDRIAGIPFDLPPETAGPRQLKVFEDTLDGVICAWIGALYLEGKCRPYGDEGAAIWVP